MEEGTGDWADWIGRQTVREDIATPRLLAEYRATLGPYLFGAGSGEACPPGLHWGLAPQTPAMADLGADGSEAKGLFLPPIPLQRRMWAGGLIETLAPVLPGAMVRRVSSIAGINGRTGKSGALCFVSIDHEIESGGRLAIRERQDLVYRQAGTLAGKPAGAEPPHDGLRWTLEASPALLFRFSAFSFNGHRIHYDLPYAASEGYPGLVVHGPLQAALMLNQAAFLLGRVPPRFEYRCLAPLFGGSSFTVSSAMETQGAASRISRYDGVTTAEARVSVRP